MVCHITGEHGLTVLENKTLREDAWDYEGGNHRKL
jgi:hypothetical protein